MAHCGIGMYETEPERDFVKVSTTLGVCRQGRIYRVVEIVTPQGHYIQHDGSYSTQAAAIQEAQKF
jgi:hypothetical protein